MSATGNLFHLLGIQWELVQHVGVVGCCQLYRCDLISQTFFPPTWKYILIGFDQAQKFCKQKFGQEKWLWNSWDSYFCVLLYHFKGYSLKNNDSSLSLTFKAHSINKHFNSLIKGYIFTALQFTNWCLSLYIYIHRCRSAQEIIQRWHWHMEKLFHL